MRKAGGLAGVGEGEREGTPYQQNSIDNQQNSIDKRFKTVFCRSFPQNSIDKRFKTVFCRSFPQNSI
jgi:hypothetical protein